MVIGVGANNNTNISGMIVNNTLPWTKDDNLNNVWENWEIENRDLIFMNNKSQFVYRINLTDSFDKTLIKEIISEINDCDF